MRRTVKRAFDVILSATVLIMASPLFIALALAVWASIGRPVIFTQQRVGLANNTFRLLKFRTMTQASDKSGVLLPDRQRLTSVGSFLRRWSLDELPQLLNVLGGSMSIVGPRPLLVRYLPRYSPAQLRRHDVKPGITGLAQVNGRNALSWEERFRYDVDYVDHWSLALDARIIFQTLLLIVRGSGSGARAADLAEEFMGTVGEGSATGVAREGKKE
jgi:sugar transferase EpsL